jgi:hypothetical protein
MLRGTVRKDLLERIGQAMILDISDAHKPGSNRENEYDPPADLVRSKVLSETVEEDQETDFDGPQTNVKHEQRHIRPDKESVRIMREVGGRKLHPGTDIR